VDFLRESHPQLLNDEKFIAARNQAALDIYEDVIKNGGILLLVHLSIGYR
jgi:hypothetical protein